jgi:hypothetical protein
MNNFPSRLDYKRKGSSVLIMLKQQFERRELLTGNRGTGEQGNRGKILIF